MNNIKKSIIQSQKSRYFDSVFNTNGGPTLDPLVVATGNVMPDYRYDYIDLDNKNDIFSFGGWYKDSEFNNEWNLASDIVQTDNTLHAYWTIPDEVVYTTPGTYSWTCPKGVTSVSVVCVGGGGTGPYLKQLEENAYAQGGYGGALAYKNNIPVIPGTIIYSSSRSRWRMAQI